MALQRSAAAVHVSEKIVVKPCTGGVVAVVPAVPVAVVPPAVLAALVAVGDRCWDRCSKDK